MAPISRHDAVATLESGQAELDGLFDQLSDEELSEPRTISGGWAAKDVMGHIAFWEELGLETVDDVRGGRRPRTVDVGGQEGTDRLNAENQAATAAQSATDSRGRAASTHEALLAAIHSLTDAEWHERTAETTLGELLGGVLGMPERPFGHAFAHVADLKAYVEK